MPRSIKALPISIRDAPFMYSAYIQRMISASSGMMTSLSSCHSYPKMLNLPLGMPCLNRLIVPHLTFSEMLRLSSCAKEARMESISSPSPLKELMFSFSKRTSMPRSFRCRTVFRRSTVFLANRWIDLVRMMSMFPASHSASMRLNSSRFLVPVPEIP